MRRATLRAAEAELEQVVHEVGGVVEGVRGERRCDRTQQIRAELLRVLLLVQTPLPVPEHLAATHLLRVRENPRDDGDQSERTNHLARGVQLVEGVAELLHKRAGSASGIVVHLVAVETLLQLLDAMQHLDHGVRVASVDEVLDARRSKITQSSRFALRNILNKTTLYHSQKIQKRLDTLATEILVEAIRMNEQ